MAEVSKVIMTHYDAWYTVTMIQFYGYDTRSFTLIVDS